MVIVLFQLRTFTLLTLISVTTPSAPFDGISIQSPGWIMSCAEIWIDATKPRIVSLNTSDMMAAEAPSPTSSWVGSLRSRIAMPIMPAMM